MGKSVMCCKFQIISARGGVGLATNVACEQAPKWGIISAPHYLGNLGSFLGNLGL